MHMLNERDTNGAEQWCPMKGGGCISEVSFNKGLTVYSF